MNSLFIQIASYRDSELAPTVKDLLEKAKFPTNITIGVLNQYSEEDNFNLDEIKDVIKLKEIDCKESKGTCWARNIVQQLYDGEDFSLQLDSHHRFEKDWDEILFKMYESLEDEKAILTSYPAQYRPEWSYDQYHKEVYICRIKGFSGDGKIESTPHVFENWRNAKKPKRAAHVAAGFIFGKGEINKKVPYDPQFYFSGEESSLAVRYFTHGYNLYHPHKIISYHYYERKDQPKHWTDHNDWNKYNIIANNRLNCLIGRNNEIDLGEYGLGDKRTLEDWKKYSGIDFINNIVHQDALDAKEPPCSNSEEGWNQENEFNHIVSWNDSVVQKCDDPRFWAFFIVDQNRVALHREDIVYKNNPEIINGIVKSRLFKFKYRNQKPSQLLIWPYSESKGWLNNCYQPLKIL